MFAGKKVVVVMPAYNAAQTLIKTYDEVIAQGVVDRVIVVDDASRDETVNIARTLPDTTVHRHPENRGYGANQKTCYRLALDEGADIVIMVHPDYQYTPKLIPAMVSLIGNELYECVLGSRILGGYALEGRHAAMEVRGKPVPHVDREYAHRRETLRVPHRLQGLLAKNPRDDPPRCQFGRFYFRQPDASPGAVAWFYDRGGQLSDAVQRRLFID